MNPTLKGKFQQWKQRDPYLTPRQKPSRPPASTTFFPLTEEMKAQQERDRIKYNLPF